MTSYLAVPVISRSGEVHGGLFFGHQAEAGGSPPSMSASFSAWRVMPQRRSIMLVSIRAPSGKIIARRAVEADLRESNDRFRAAVDAVHGVLWTNTPEGRMEGDQPALVDADRAGAEEYRGPWLGCAARVHPDDAGPMIEAWEQAVAAATPFIFEQWPRADQAWRHFCVRAIPDIRDRRGTAPMGRRAHGYY